MILTKINYFLTNKYMNKPHLISTSAHMETPNSISEYVDLRLYDETRYTYIVKG